MMNGFEVGAFWTNPTDQSEVHWVANKYPQKRPHFHSKIHTTGLIWNDRCQVNNIRLFFIFLHFFQ